MHGSLTYSPATRWPAAIARSAGVTLARPGYGPPSAERLIAAAAICALIIVVAMTSSPECRHWFIIPLFACGTICCFDGLLLFSDSGHNVFQPVPLLGAFGTYFFLIAPLLHVARNYWFTADVWAPKELPEDWRTWIGLMAIVNLVGLGVYKSLCRPFTKLFLKRGSSYRKLRVELVRSIGVPFAGVVLLLQIYIYYRFGGISGFVDAFSTAIKGQESELTGLGWLFAISESFPVVLVIVCISLFKENLQKVRFLPLGLYVVPVFALALVFGGLRGGRGNTIYTMIYIVGIVHLTVRPLSRTVFVSLIAFLMLFMYIYGFYKASPEVFSDPLVLFHTVTSYQERAALETRTGRNVNGILMGDLDRSDLQAYLLFRILNGPSIDYAYGRTYVEGALNFIPSFILPYRPPGKLMYGNNVVFGRGTYSPKIAYSKIYGLAGEMMLNFGVYGAPFGFMVLAGGVGYAQALSSRLHAHDARRYFVPIISVACVVLLSCDLDNVIFVLLQHALVPLCLIWLCSIRAVERKLDVSAQNTPAAYV